MPRLLSLLPPVPLGYLPQKLDEWFVVNNLFDKSTPLSTETEQWADSVSDEFDHHLDAQLPKQTLAQAWGSRMFCFNEVQVIGLLLMDSLVKDLFVKDWQIIWKRGS